MKKKIIEYNNRHQLIQTDDNLLIGLSGGADSVCLLYVLSQLRQSLSLTLQALHVHHGLRGKEADQDAAFVKELCEQWEVPCFVVYKDVSAYAVHMGISEEEAGRLLRYQMFEEYARELNCTKIAVAHHQDDAAETVMHHLMRGSGLKGLNGITRQRGQIVRPLLCCRRWEIEAFLAQHQIRYCIDSSNAADCYTRNRIRNKLLPLMTEEFNQRAVENILHAAQLAGEADQYLEQQAAALLDERLVVQTKALGIEAAFLYQQPPIIQKYMVKEMLYRACGSRRDLGMKHIEQILLLLEKPVGKTIQLPYEQLACKDYKIIWIRENKREVKKDVLGQGLIPQLQYQQFAYEKHMKIPKNQYTKWFDYDKIKDTLSVRWRQPGDFMLLSNGGRKTIKAYMIDEKIPREEREKIPLLTENSHVLWIIGYRVSEYYKITENTEHVLQVQYDGGQKNGR